jgi:hypothetical protein
VDEPELRTDTDRPDGSAPPDSERDSRPDTERRDEREDRDDRDDERELLPEPLPPAATPVGGDDTEPSPDSRPRPDGAEPDGETTGASPQVSQYSRPPPTSSYEPSQPGR